jgi:hypothetical protein
MSKHYGARCTGVGSDCVDDPLAWCERVGNLCTGGTMGDIGIQEKAARLSRAEFQKAMAASATKFLLNDKGAFVEVGLFAAAGLQVGDRLVNVGRANMANPKGRIRVLNFKFDTNRLKVGFLRGDDFHITTMENPIFKQS